MVFALPKGKVCTRMWPAAPLARICPTAGQLGILKRLTAPVFALTCRGNPAWKQETTNMRTQIMLALPILLALALGAVAGVTAQTERRGAPAAVHPLPRLSHHPDHPRPRPAHPGARLAALQGRAPVHARVAVRHEPLPHRPGAQRQRSQPAGRPGRAGRRQVVAGRAILGEFGAQHQGPVQLGHLRQPPGGRRRQRHQRRGHAADHAALGVEQPRRARLLLVRAEQLHRLPDFVRAAVNRWKNQIHVWEIWNEPNSTRHLELRQQLRPRRRLRRAAPGRLCRHQVRSIPTPAC